MKITNKIYGIALMLTWGLAATLNAQDLFVADNGSTIGEYTNSGAMVNASLISGLDELYGIAATTSMPPLNISTVGNQSVLFYPSWASQTTYVLQYVTNLASTNWLVMTNGVPIMGVTVTNNLPASFFRLVPAQ